MLRRASATMRFGLTLLAFGLLPLLSQGTASAKNGMVVTKDGDTFVGDVDEKSEPGFVTIATSSGKFKHDVHNVRAITYFATPADEFKGRLASIGSKDVAARLQLATFAKDNKMYPQARELLVSTLEIDPANHEATDMLKEVDDQIKASQPPQTQPATSPAEKPARPGSDRARRTLTPDEINALRQSEWTDKDTAVVVKVSPEARKGAIDLGLIGPEEIGRMSPAQIGWEIIHKGPAKLQSGVKLTNDPASLASYKSQVQRFLITSCATGACHNTEKGGNFFVFADQPQADVNTLSDYIILQEYSKTISGTEYQMIDRLRPEDSLLVQFALPATVATVPHPKAAGYVPPAKAPFTLRQVQAWIGALPAVAPTYDVDLSKPAPKAQPATRPAVPGPAGRGGVGAR